MESVAQIKIFNKKLGAVAYDSAKGVAFFEFEEFFFKLVTIYLP